MDRYQIRYFLAVVETGNFSKAAARVNVAQPTLSVGIAKLEAALGAKLFQRSSRRVHLTDSGSRFLPHARQIMQDYNLARSEEHTSELQSLMRNSYAVFCLKKKTYDRINKMRQKITKKRQ